jgi:hypothetical protein
LNILLVYGYTLRTKSLITTFISTYVAILLLLTKTNESWKPLGTLFKTLEKTPYQTRHSNGNIIRSRTKVFWKRYLPKLLTNGSFNIAFINAFNFIYIGKYIVVGNNNVDDANTHDIIVFN